METISRDQVKQMMEHNGVLIIDTLSQKAFEEYHLPHAINVPVDDRFEEHIQTAAPDKDQEVIVYCMSRECDASSKAADRMEKLGYRHVLKYEDGKQDWKAAGLPVESAQPVGR